METIKKATLEDAIQHLITRCHIPEWEYDSVPEEDLWSVNVDGAGLITLVSADGKATFTAQLVDATPANCVCGNCDGPYVDPEFMDYLESHFECDYCGSDFPIDQLTVVEYASTVFHYCQTCSPIMLGGGASNA